MSTRTLRRAALTTVVCLLALTGAATGTPSRAGAPATARPPALDRLLEHARATHSDALFVARGDDVLLDWTADDDPRPVELMSALKSLVAVAVGRLLQLGELQSLDTTVAELYPEWRQGRKAAITVRQLMNHTSGLQNVPSAGVEIYPAPDAVQLALSAELSADPGTEFAYNNKAVNLLAGIIERASGQRMDLFFRERLFAPLDIDEYQWYFDASGGPHAMAGLRLLARDAAKFGRLMLEDGVWEGERLLPEGYVDEVLAQGQPYYPRCGLLWWRELDDGGKPRGYYADGYLGQYIVIVPSAGVVAVRQIANSPGYDEERDGYDDFRLEVIEMAAMLSDTPPPAPGRR